MNAFASISGSGKQAATTEAGAGAHKRSSGSQQSSDFSLQCRLQVGAASDSMETAAESMAEKVTRMPEQNFIQRKCAHCEEEEQIRKKPLPSFIQRKAADGSGAATDAVHTGIAATKGGGSPLSGQAKNFMENRFDADFSGVKIHTGSYATQLADELNAQAFTVGNDIYFNENKYQPSSESGKRLLAHELTHTLQQGGVIRRDKNKQKEEDAGLLSLKKNISDGHWKEAYQFLIGQWMKIMLEKLDALSEAEIDALIANADTAKNAKDSNFGESGKARALAGILAVKAVKKSDWSDAGVETAVQNTLTLPFDQRKEIIDYLSGSKSKAAKKLHAKLSKPFLGYTASAYDFSDRFLRQSDKLGFGIESSTNTLPKNSWTGDDPDPQPAPTTEAATKSFEQSDMVFFSGHQYAQYHRPGLYTNDTSDSCFNISAISKKLDKVKLVASTSCATICKDVAAIYKAKFPMALVLGYKYSAPLNGALVSDSFANNLVKKGPVDLSAPAGLEAVKDSWRKATTSNPGTAGQPGILEGDNVEFYNGSKWQTVKADSKENECHYH